jgi:hypothetical protein
VRFVIFAIVSPFFFEIIPRQAGLSKAFIRPVQNSRENHLDRFLVFMFYNLL